MELEQPVDRFVIPTRRLEPLYDSVRVGYECGEHDVENSGLHHRIFAGDPMDAEGWDGDFPVDGYFAVPTEEVAH